MTDIYPPDPAPSGAVDTVKEQASELAQSARASASDVAHSAAAAASDVAGEAKRQAKDLLHESRAELLDQAGAQQHRVAEGLKALGDELGGMARSSDDPGVAADLVSQAASRAHAAANWLDARDPGSLLAEVKGFARRSPGTFIGLAAIAGVVAGRLTKNLTAQVHEDAAAPTHTNVHTAASTTEPSDEAHLAEQETPADTDLGAAMSAPTTDAAPMHSVPAEYRP
ncbi:hypothetical protein [Plantibacter sp. YIM 135347]|uniref:hypothetical protein n=1 Tax=Plantibacter sp. YIM 135347 TaxID=3423919 RepID=UPI003D32FBB6